jgi:cell division septation protein DedD
MQSPRTAVQIDDIHRDPMTATIIRSPAAMMAVITLLVSLGACSVLDSKRAGYGQLDIPDSESGQTPVDGRTRTPARAVARAAAGQQGLESMVEQLIEEQQQYEARLQALEAIVLHGYPLVPADGYPGAGMPDSSAATAERLVSVPIEPDVITRPVRQPASPAGASRVSRTTPPSEPDSVSVEPAPVRSQSAANRGQWAINLASYTSRSIAERMLARFRQQEIAAELVTAVVNDATVYRVRITGFESRQAAFQHAESLQERLGIGDVWITRN